MVLRGGFFGGHLYTLGFIFIFLLFQMVMFVFLALFLCLSDVCLTLYNIV